MAARNATHMNYTMNREQVSLTGKCVGNAGASPTGLKGIGIASIAWVSTGKYTITLADKYAALLGAQFMVIDSTGLTLSSVFISAETVATNKTITIEVFGGASTVAPTRRNLAATDTLRFILTMSNTSQVPNGN